LAEEPWERGAAAPAAERCAAFASPEVRAELKDDSPRRQRSAQRGPADALADPHRDEHRERGQRALPRRNVGEIAAEQGRDAIDVAPTSPSPTGSPRSSCPTAPSGPIRRRRRSCSSSATTTTSCRWFRRRGATSTSCRRADAGRALAVRVREQDLLSLEEVVTVHRQRGRGLRLTDRGTLAVGQAADVCVFALDRVGAESPQLVRDLPATASVSSPIRSASATRSSTHRRQRRGTSTGALPGSCSDPRAAVGQLTRLRCGAQRSGVEHVGAAPGPALRRARRVGMPTSAATFRSISGSSRGNASSAFSPTSLRTLVEREPVVGVRDREARPRVRAVVGVDEGSSGCG